MSLRLLVSTAALACALAGCASEGPQPTEQLARARTLVDQADKAQAQRYAAADLQRAHDELSQAESANGEKKYVAARALAESAAADADVAAARAEAGEAQRAAREVAQSNSTVQQESERATDAAAAATAAGGLPPRPAPPAPAAPAVESYPQAPPAPPDSQSPPR